MASASTVGFCSSAPFPYRSHSLYSRPRPPVEVHSDDDDEDDDSDGFSRIRQRPPLSPARLRLQAEVRIVKRRMDAAGARPSSRPLQSQATTARMRPTRATAPSPTSAASAARLAAPSSRRAAVSRPSAPPYPVAVDYVWESPSAALTAADEEELQSAAQSVASLQERVWAKRRRVDQHQFQQLLEEQTRRTREADRRRREAERERAREAELQRAEQDRARDERITAMEEELRQSSHFAEEVQTQPMASPPLSPALSPSPPPHSPPARPVRRSLSQEVIGEPRPPTDGWIRSMEEVVWVLQHNPW